MLRFDGGAYAIRDMEWSARRQARARGRSRLRWRSTRPKILNGGEDAPLSTRARFEYRLVLAVVIVLGVYAMVVVELTRH